MPARNEKRAKNSGDWPRPNPWRARLAARKAQSLERPGENDNGGLADLIKAANDDVSDTRKELFAFVAGLVFIVVTNYSITARDLLAAAPVKLPFIGLAVPLVDFFFWTPLAIVVVHVAVLLRLVRLREKLEAIRNAVDELGGEERAEHLLKTVSNFFAQLIVVRPKARGRRILLTEVYLSAAFIAPLVALLAITVRALPLHSVGLTFSQNVLFSADVGLAAYLFQERRKIFGLGSFAVTIILVNLVLCVPDSGFDRLGSSVPFLSKSINSATSGPQRVAFWPTAVLFESDVNNVTRRPRLLGLSRNIVLVDDKPLAAAVAEPPMSVRGRDLRYAIFDRSSLAGADFTAADLYRRALSPPI